MSAVEEYRTALEYAASRAVFLTSGAVEILADAAIADLEAENERLQVWQGIAREQMSNAALRAVDDYAEENGER